MSLTLIFSGSSSSSSGAGVVLVPGREYQDLLFTVSGSPAGAVYGKLELDYLGDAAPLDASSGLPSAAAALGTFESVWGAGNVEATARNKGYRLGFIGDLDEYDIVEATLTPSTTYPLNDGTGSDPSLTSQQGYLPDGPNGTAERFSVSVGVGSGFINFTDGLNSGTVEVSSGVIVSVSQPSQYSVTAGGIGSSSVQFTSTVTGERSDQAITTDDTGGASLFVEQQGAPQQGQVVVNLGSGAAGWTTYADSTWSDTTPVTFSRGLSQAAIDTLLNDASRYNGNVTVTKSTPTLTLDFVSTVSPGTVTITGKTGAAVVAAVTTVQDGTYDFPSLTNGATFTRTEGGTTAFTATATGGKPSLTYSISGGVDAAQFNIDGSTGVVAFDAATDFGVPTDDDEDNEYLLTVRVTDDGGQYDELAVAVTVDVDLNVGALGRWGADGTVLEAAADPAENTDTVYQINDQISTNHLVQATSGNRPTYNTNVQNGLPMIYFDTADVGTGNNKFLESTLTRASFGSSAHWIGVAKIVADTTDRELWGLVNNASNFHQWFLSKDSADKLYSNGYDGTNHSAVDADAMTSRAVCIGNVFRPNPGNNEIWIDGVSKGTVAAGTPSIASGRPFRVGPAFYGGNFHLGEVIAYDGTTTDIRMAGAMQKLMTKWGIS